MMYAKLKKDASLKIDDNKRDFNHIFSKNSISNKLDQKCFDKNLEKLIYKEDASTTILILNDKNFNKTRANSAEMYPSSSSKSNSLEKLKLKKFSSDHKILKRNTLDPAYLHQIVD